MSPPLVKVFGERNTGTRALLKMLRNSGAVTIRMANKVAVGDRKRRAAMSEQIDAHFKGAWRKLYRDALRDNDRHISDPLLTWKHAAPEWNDCFRREGASIIFIVRNPYSWAISMARRPYHLVGRRPDDLTEFVTRPWLAQERDNTDKLLPDVLALWQAKVLAFRKFSQQAKSCGVSTYFLQFEEFVADPVANAAAALGHFGIANNTLKPTLAHTKDKGRNLSEIQTYYGQEQWREYLCAQSVDLINQRVDWDLAGRMGYARFDPTEFGTTPVRPLHNDQKPELANDPRPPVLLDREAGSATAT